MPTTRRVILVAWGVDERCRAMPVGAPTWVTSREAIVMARLRPRTAWIAGTPTLDLSDGGYWPWPRAAGDTTRAPLPLRDAWPLMLALPRGDDTLSSSARRSWRSIVAWGNAHPHDADRDWVRDLLCHAHRQLYGDEDCASEQPASCLRGSAVPPITATHIGSLDLTAPLAELRARCTGARATTVTGQGATRDTAIQIDGLGLRITGSLGVVQEPFGTDRTVVLEPQQRVAWWRITGWRATLPLDVPIDATWDTLRRRLGPMHLYAENVQVYATSCRLPGIIFELNREVPLVDQPDDVPLERIDRSARTVAPPVAQGAIVRAIILRAREPADTVRWARCSS
jgi:hypothetical protein